MRYVIQKRIRNESYQNGIELSNHISDSYMRSWNTQIYQTLKCYTYYRLSL